MRIDRGIVTKAENLKKGDIVKVISRSHGRETVFSMRIDLVRVTSTFQEGNPAVVGWDISGNRLSIGGGTRVLKVPRLSAESIEFKRK